jgi:hypothetical protein
MPSSSEQMTQVYMRESYTQHGAGKTYVYYTLDTILLDHQLRCQTHPPLLSVFGMIHIAHGRVQCEMLGVKGMNVSLR